MAANGEKTWPRLGEKMAVGGEKQMAVDSVDPASSRSIAAARTNSFICSGGLQSAASCVL